LNSVYARLRANAIAGSCREALFAAASPDFLFSPILTGHFLVTNECLNFK
jgi:hypothetical protein